MQQKNKELWENIMRTHTTSYSTLEALQWAFTGYHNMRPETESGNEESPLRSREVTTILVDTRNWTTNVTTKYAKFEASEGCWQGVDEQGSSQNNDKDKDKENKYKENKYRHATIPNNNL